MLGSSRTPVAGEGVCLYDRAGMGWSDPRPQPRDADHVAAELQTFDRMKFESSFCGNLRRRSHHAMFA
jgi:hypothetical protein